MSEKKIPEEMNQTAGHFHVFWKMMQYVMLVVLFVAAILLPVYGGRLDVKESAGQQADKAAGENNSGSNGGSEGASGTKGTIVLDAGHGGFDPGMTGASGITEKELNLIYAKKLEVLLSEAGYHVVQTRTTEAGLYDENETHKKAQDMQRRVAVIEQEKPVVTISIHQNSYPQDASVCGPQVFYFEHSAEGKELATSIQNCINTQLQVERPRVPKGNGSYYILKRSASTTVIVECGFLTNPAEEAKLQEEAYQDSMVRAVCDGILQYLGSSTAA